LVCWIRSGAAGRCIRMPTTTPTKAPSAPPTHAPMIASMTGSPPGCKPARYPRNAHSSRPKGATRIASLCFLALPAFS
jgi:hypothetical protein